MTTPDRSPHDDLGQLDFSDTEDLDPTHMDAQALEDLRNRLQDADPTTVIANHCYGLFELAAVYLSTVPPKLAEAQLSIDALGALVNGLGTRLGVAHEELHDGLASLRLAYVQLHAATVQEHQ